MRSTSRVLVRATTVLALGGLLAAAATALPAQAERRPVPGGPGAAQLIDHPSAGPGRVGGERVGRAPRTQPDVGDVTPRGAVIGRAVTFTDWYKDDTALPAARRLSRATVTQDLVGGKVVVKANFRAVPTAATESLLVAFVGNWEENDNGDEYCDPKFVLLGGAYDKAGAVYGFTGDTSDKVATNVGRGTMTLTAADSRIRGAAWSCANVDLRDPASPTTVSFVESYYESLTEVERAELRVDPSYTDPMVGARKGRWTKIDVDVENDADSPAPGTVVTASGKGIQVKSPKRRVGTIAAGDDRSLRFKVRVKVPRKGRYKKVRTLQVRAVSGRVRASRKFTVVITPKKRKPKSLVGNYYWASEPSSPSDYTGWRVHTYRFVSKKLVSVKNGPHGQPLACGRVSKTCQRYSYNRRTGQLKIGKLKAKVTTEGIHVGHPQYRDKLWFAPLHLPKKGTKLGFDLYHQNWSGNCMITCTTWTETLVVNKKNRRFVIGGYSIGSWPGMGTYWSSVSDDSKGTYTFVKKGVIRLKYASGKVETKMFGIELNPLLKPDTRFGVVSGWTPFY